MRKKYAAKLIQKSAQGLLERKDVYKTGGDRKSHRQITYGWMLAGIMLLLGICSRAHSFHSGEIDADIFPNPAVLSGSLRLAGSSSMERMAGALAEGFMEVYPDVNVTIEYVGSAAGIEAVLNGSADIGNSSRKLKEEELARGAVENVIGMDKIAVCVDPANRLSGLSLGQLADIYTGKITNWSELGGDDIPIVVVGHEAGSGTREAFEELLGIKDKCIYANELNSMGAVKARAALIPGAIGYISCEVLDDSVKALLLDGADPADNGEDGSYPLCRPFVMVTRGEIARQNELVQAWFAYVYQVRDGEGEW